MRLILATILIALSTAGSAHTQGLYAVRSLPGYVCMNLAISDAQSLDPKVGVPVREAPSRAAPVLNYAASVVIVQDSPQLTQGFRRVLRPNGEEGWIEAIYLRPWANPFVPSARCVPSMMSNGKPGFGSGR